MENGNLCTGYMLHCKTCEDYQKNVNPNFTWEYEMVASDNLQQKIATLAASNDLPDLFAYEAGAPLSPPIAYAG